MTSTEGGQPAQATPAEGPGADLGWGRAIASGLGILLVGFVAAVYAANEVVTRLTSMARSTRQYLAATLFVVVVVAMAWVLRRLQARRLI